MLYDDQRTNRQNFVKDVILCQLIYRQNSGQRFAKDVKDDRPKGKSATLCERRHMTILLSKSTTLCKKRSYDNSYKQIGNTLQKTPHDNSYK